MVAPGFSISDLLQVSYLAIKLYRRCRDSPDEFSTLQGEVANLRNLVDDVRLTVKERRECLTVDQEQQILDLGQGCLTCLCDLEALLRKHQSLGNKAKRTFDRLQWDKRDVEALRGRLTTNISLLTSFNTSLTRSATARIERLLRGFIDDYKAGRHEGSVLSVETIRSIKKNGTDDIWKDIQKDFEAFGISPEQLAENRKLIIDSIKKAIEASDYDAKSPAEEPRNTLTDGGSNRFSGSTAFMQANMPPALDWPGAEFYWCKDLVNSVGTLYRDAPDDYANLKHHVSDTRRIIIEIGHERQNIKTLLFHEHVCRKPAMLPIIEKLTEVLKSLTNTVEWLKPALEGSETNHEWTTDKTKIQEAEKLLPDLELHSGNLKNLFDSIDHMLLCDLEDNINLIINETKDKQRSTSILSAWEELESELADSLEVPKSEIHEHKDAVVSFVQSETEEWLNMDQPGYEHIRTGSVGAQSTAFFSESGLQDASRTDSGPFGSFKDRSSVTDSDVLPSIKAGEIRKTSPARMSILFVDLNNTVRSPIAQAYLEYLRSSFPALASCISRISSAGITASKAGLPLSAGIDFMLRDYGINPNFQHKSRRLEKRDVEKFEYTLVMSNAQREDVLSRWPLRSEHSGPEPPSPDEIFREDLYDKVVVLGSFGGHGVREVALQESINHVYWFHVGTKRIYPGYDGCFDQIKAYMADFILEKTGIDVTSHAFDVNEGKETRDASHNVSDDEGFNSGRASPTWSNADDAYGIEALKREISRHQETSTSQEHNGFPEADSPIHVTIKANQNPFESDEDVLHKHHEQFDRLMRLLLTDVGDDSYSSLRKMVLNWENDNSQNILAVSTGACKWVLEKTTTDPNEACQRCVAGGYKSGFVRDAQLEVITVEEADIIAQYLSIAIKQSQQDTSITEEQARALELIRDSDGPRPAAAPSIRDDVSVSVRNDKPHLEHEVAKIRQRGANKKQSQAEKLRAPTMQAEIPDPALTQRLVRRKTDESMFSMRNKLQHRHKDSTISQETVKPRMRELDPVETPPARTSSTKELASLNTAVDAVQVPVAPDAPVSILFLGSSHLHGPIMAEVYLFSLVEKNMALACRVDDVVSSGIRKITADNKLNPKKLERLFHKHDILHCWPKKPERLLAPEDVVDFNYILKMDNAEREAPYKAWADDNPDEAQEMEDEAAETGVDWRENFKSKVENLRIYDIEKRREELLMDPVKPGSGGKSKFGVPLSHFEKHLTRIKCAVDGFLLTELGFDVEKNQFINPKKTTGADEAAST